MQYLTLAEIKKQCNIDQDFTDDDEYLTLLGDSAEDIISQLVGCELVQLEAENGIIPASIMHAMRMIVDWQYSVQRGSSTESQDIPQAIFTLCKLYRNYH